jgi:cytochrome c oxidase assembly protein subunit 17
MNPPEPAKIGADKQTIRPAIDADGNSLKPCCACPETRKARDECVLLKGEEDCHDYIEAHRSCLQSYGFIV